MFFIYGTTSGKLCSTGHELPPLFPSVYAPVLFVHRAFRDAKLYKDTNKPRAKTNLFVLCRGGVSKAEPKITNKPRAKTNFICALPGRSI